jgi:EAL domain-containing protein (putative c-di-GMP-specific phosphodiesterase class I)
VLWSAQRHRLLESDPNQSVSIELLLDAVHPDDRNLVAASVRKSWLSARPQQLEHRLLLALNVSGQQLDPEEEPLDQLLLGLCQQWGIPAPQLEVEVTETALISHPTAAARTLTALASLQRLPLQRLKIDRCFVTDLASSASDRSIVKATILMAHELGLSCLAEGVETDTQLEQLLNLGCDSFQGFLLGKPMAAHGLEELIRSESAMPPHGH